MLGAEVDDAQHAEAMVRGTARALVPLTGNLELHRRVEATGKLTQCSEACADLQSAPKPTPLAVATEGLQQSAPSEPQPIANLRVEPGRAVARALHRNLEVVLPQGIRPHAGGAPGGPHV